MKQKIVLIDTGLTIVAILLLAGLAMACTGCQSAEYTDGPHHIKTTTPFWMQNQLNARLKYASPSNTVEVTVERKVSTYASELIDFFNLGRSLAK